MATVRWKWFKRSWKVHRECGSRFASKSLPRTLRGVGASKKEDDPSFAIVITHYGEFETDSADM